MAILTLDLGSFAMQKGLFHELKAYISGFYKHKTGFSELCFFYFEDYFLQNYRASLTKQTDANTHKKFA
jgi:hypothetical protein